LIHELKALPLVRGEGFFIKFASENPFLWTGMKDASDESRK
jgi:hypothetical protein